MILYSLRGLLGIPKSQGPELSRLKCQLNKVPDQSVRQGRDSRSTLSRTPSRNNGCLDFSHPHDFTSGWKFLSLDFTKTW